MQRQSPKSAKIKKWEMPSVHEGMGKETLRNSKTDPRKNTRYTHPLTPPVEVPRKWRFNSGAKTAEITPLLAKDVQAPEVRYTPEAIATIQYIVANSPEEVGWWGLVEKTSYGYLITDIYLPEQTVCAVETDIQPPAMAALCNEIIDAGKCPSNLYYWGHSHVNMGVSPSMQDERQTDELLGDLPVLIRGIYNKQNESKVDVFDLNQGVVFQCVKTCTDTLTQEEKQHLDELLLTNVKTRSKAPAVTSQTGYFSDDRNTSPPTYDTSLITYSGEIVDLYDVDSFDSVRGEFCFLDGTCIHQSEFSIEDCNLLFELLDDLE